MTAPVTAPAHILVFDSGLGGLTVLSAIRALRPQDHYTYVADDEAFPYGRLGETQLVGRVGDVMAQALRNHAPDVAVIACNTASTLVLENLRTRWPDIPFVGTVPAIKPAAERSKSRLVSVLATPGTVARDYTQALIRDHAAHCDVNLVGSEHLAAMAEAHMKGERISDDDIARELAPCFIERNGARTDQIVLACTHYPLLLERFEAIAAQRENWPVAFIEPAPAIARRTDHVLRNKGDAAHAEASHGAKDQAIFTSGKRPEPALEQALQRFGLQSA